MEHHNKLNNWQDITVLLVYFAAVLAVGLWSMRSSKRGNVKGYFLASRTMPWVAVGASLFSSNIGSEHFIGLAGAGASTGIAMILFEWSPVFLILLLGWYFIPVYISSGVYTLPEYMEKRLGGNKIRIYISILFLVLAVVTKLAVNMFAGGLFIQMATGWNMYMSVIILLAVTGFYTILGGLKAVMYTDTFQAVVLTLGALLLFGIAFSRVGSLENLEQLYMNATATIQVANSSCGLPKKDAFHVFLDPVNGEQPWPGLLVCSSLGCVAYWCCDQVIVQRSLAAKSLSHAKGGSVMAAGLKLLPLFLMILPGMISRVLFPDEVACADPDECMRICDNSVGCSNIAYPKLVLELLPNGLRGFMMAVVLSAVMSSLTSIFNSSSTLFTMDLWRRFRPRSTQRELLIVGRVFILFMCVLSIVWLPLIKSSQGGQLFAYLNMVLASLMAPAGPAFLMAIFWKRTTEIGVIGGLLITHVCGMVRLVLEFAFPAPPCGQPETRPAIIYNFHFLYFGLFNVFLAFLAIGVISLLTRPRTDEELQHVTWWTRVMVPNTTTEEKDEEHGTVDNNDINLKPVKDEAVNNTTIGGKYVSDEETCQDDQISIIANERTCLVKFTSFLFGEPELGREITTMSLRQKQIFMTERKEYKWLLDASAVFMIAVVMFLAGYFA
ncbi:sodium/glucose cotransporter 5-like isoform X2 [Pecten maximus]|uniref:sodium/glucose cotransporter 5-like isoform X2 n=1 Tax=Pecten maximus TaxID=6579 RepID=UPI001458091F|nr:sodium/glucose cotransporter 5-like isoform X2 [Pecten maximus]XP_033731838.1 sodium/glucose cotransporter 5-like isoform X2 [Pecten maximus]XP_033731839.1 sodium/glucose cotransporter 5-like isoform X2 [Pecten maximus]